MFLRDVRGEAIGRHSLPAEPAEGLAWRDVDALHSQQHEWLSVRTSSARGTQAPVVGVYFDRCWPADRSHCGVTRSVPFLLTASPIIAATCRGSDCWRPLRRYEITAQVGVGGMGEVCRATRHQAWIARSRSRSCPTPSRSDPDRLARFDREAKTLASLNHPNIAHIHGLEEADGVRALVMELVEGRRSPTGSRQGPIPVDEALPIARQIAEALEAAHEQGIVHRDLKPANIKVRTDGTVKVLDFGLAKAFDSTAAGIADVTASPTITSPALMTGVGVILGTAAYMSPEQARGRAVDRRTDVWAFGCVLFEMMTGRMVFPGATVSDTIAAILERSPDWTALPPATPPAVRHVLARCLEKDPKRRWRDVGDVRIELDDAKRGNRRRMAHRRRPRALVNERRGRCWSR